MDNRVLFTAALGLQPPWEVGGIEFDPKARRLDLHLDFARGSRFPCPEGDEDRCGVHDTEDKTWRHLDFFQHQAYLHARVPRVRCAAHGVRQAIQSGLGGQCPVVGVLELRRRDVTDRFEEPPVVEPVHPLERAVLDVVDALPRPPPADELGLVQPDDGLREGVGPRRQLHLNRPMETALSV